MSDEAQTEEDVDIEAAIGDATEAVQVASQQLDELGAGAASGDPVSMAQLMDVPVEVTVEVGSVRVNLGELMQLGAGSVLELDREAHEPADILVNGKVVARGEIVTVGGRYGVRIVSVGG